MSSFRNHAEISLRPSLAERCISPETDLCLDRNGGVSRVQNPNTLLDNWKTGTMLPLRSSSKVLAWLDCLAKRTFKSRTGLREAWSGSSFHTNLLDNWKTGTSLSPLCPSSANDLSYLPCRSEICEVVLKWARGDDVSFFSRAGFRGSS